MEYGDLKLGKAHNVSEFQGERKSDKQQSVSPLVEQMNTLLKLDSVATVDVRTSILTRRLAALPIDSDERNAVEQKLADAIQQRSIISATIDEIARRSFQINGDFNKVFTEHMELTKHDCYISATQRIHEKCFDIMNEYALHKLWIVANLCEIGLQDFTINNAVDDVCNDIGRQDFDY